MKNLSYGWVKTSERMPEKRKAVLIFSPEDIEGENIHKMYYDPDSDSVEYGEWVSDCTPNRTAWFSFHEHEVSHWMELPEGPKD